MGQLQESVEGLVLKDWKVANDKNVTDKTEEAKEYAVLYRFSFLAALVLENYCYLVMASEKHLVIQQNHQPFKEKGITYRKINIVYKPDAPSTVSK